MDTQTQYQNEKRDVSGFLFAARFVQFCMGCRERRIVSRPVLLGFFDTLLGGNYKPVSI
ncbi:MAG: hypothetical protein LBK13_03500 [Spirochaetales bacterium]|jgi:hypothetical protein|nr:hypothetical protein [Spirochaetales bacterium]